MIGDKKIKIFLDDIRHPVDCVKYMHTRIGPKNPLYLDEWLIVRTYDDFKDVIIKNAGNISHVSFDHDLSDNVEIWRPVVNYEGVYEVSTFGRVKRILIKKGTSGGILSPIKNESGLYVSLHNENKKTFRKIHRLVMESFYGLNSDKPQVNHKDGNRWNNFIENLEWCTSSENVWHSHNILGVEHTAYGENHKNSMTVSKYSKNGEYLGTYGGVNEAGRQEMIPFTNIAKCARGERSSAGGFIWKYDGKDVTIQSEVKHKKGKNYSNKFFIPNIPDEKTGYDCAKWMIEYYCLDMKLPLPEIFVHSMNPVGCENIEGVFNHAKKFFSNSNQ